MLRSTFQHIKGVSHQKELELWKKGILNWDSYIDRKNDQFSFFNTLEVPNLIKPSLIAYAKGDADFFARNLHPSEYYRIALEYPREVMFIDIETTGLSLYYDIITIVGWSIGNKFGVYINGHDSTRFKKDLEQAKVIVTFNGTLFDLKFIAKHFKDFTPPKAHIDLRFFAKRCGLTGGQKAIEEILGFKRKDNIEGMLGEAAPILWHKYRRGDIEAMHRLIEYNHADVEGMKHILDFCVSETFRSKKIPAKIQKKTSFAKQKSPIDWAKRQPSPTSYKIYVPEFIGSTKPLITFSDLNKIHPLDDYCVVGIDLVSSEERETGYCILKGAKASTYRINSDEEMIQRAIDAGADLVSIDSPLSIPKGRTSFFDDDPYRHKYGITRECERTLKKRGINSYPCLIQSMQKLTQRGMLLAEKFRKRGIPVIESYPGAAQDIMSIPRKQAGLDFLVDGLAEFGITGEFVDTHVSHDELDAITSAIVGQFFWVGMFEALGNPDEEYLIIPDLNANYKKWLSRQVIGLSGAIGAGKTTVSTYLASKGFATTRFSLILQKILQDKGLRPTREELQRVGWEFQSENRQRELGKQVVKKIQHVQSAIVDGLRFSEDRALLIECFGPAFKHIHINRTSNSHTLSDKVDKSPQTRRDNVKNHPVEQGINHLASLAEYQVSNIHTKDDLFAQIDNILSFKDYKCPSALLSEANLAPKEKEKLRTI